MRKFPMIPLVVASALFMENIDSSVISTSLPAIAADLGENPLALKLALTAYLISLAVFIPVSGWVADRYGSRRVFAWAICVFMLGSLLSGVSNSLAAFVGARFLQGMGGAMMVPVGRLVLLRSVPKSGLVKALNFVTVPAVLGPFIGPPLGGFVTQTAHWRWIFFLNLPIAALGLYLVLKHVPNIVESENPPLDVRGFFLSGIGLSVLMLGLSTLGGHLISRELTYLCLVAGAVLLAIYARHALRIPHPVLDLRLLRQPAFFNGAVLGNLFRLGNGALPFLLPLMLQLGFGMGPFAAGLITCSSAIGILIMKSTTIWMFKRLGLRTVLTVNGFLAGCSLILCGLFTAQTPYWLMIAVLFLSGCLRSLQFTGLNALTYSEVSQQEMSRATSFGSMAQRLGQSLGVALGAYVLQVVGALHGHPDEVRADDFMAAFACMALVACIASLFHWRMPVDAGSEVSGHRPEAAARR